MAVEPDPAPDELGRLVAGEHSNPHHLVGYHESGRRPVVRAFRPAASSMRVLLTGGESLEMERLDDAGFFAVTVPELGGRGYRLQAQYPGGDIDTYEDPYRFMPTVGELDLHLLGEGRHQQLWRMLGARPRVQHGVAGTGFAVWAPNARSVRVVGDFNFWNETQHPLRCLGSSGVWELFIPGVSAGARYKFAVLDADGRLSHRADPMAQAAEIPPSTASIVTGSAHRWRDQSWTERRRGQDPLNRPLSIYEVHLGSWRRVPGEGNRPLTYAELAEQLPDHVEQLGFTHVELMPVAEHPFAGSWGYQVSSYYAPTSRFGTPDDFRALVDALHQRGIGVILDWVPAHFPRDEWALAHFDGTALYEHDDPRQGAHEEWGTLIFNYGRNEVRNFLVANALFWLEEFHIDGLRVDGVSSMLYLDYGRREGEWMTNHLGGRENLAAVAFLCELNEVAHGAHPGTMIIAEESTAWPAVSRPTYAGGLGFGLKWNMGWMHDTLVYFSHDPVHRQHHHHQLTFGLLYAFTENFILPLSHDEVVHGKGSLLGRMPGDRWQKAANLRALYAWMWAHPGKQLLFMGGEIAQSEEWDYRSSVDWHLLEYPEHRGVEALVSRLNRCYREEPALWERDFTDEGFSWIDANDEQSNIFSFLRRNADGTRALACIANLSPVPREGYRVGLPGAGEWREVLNSDAADFGGSGTGNAGIALADGHPWQGFDHSALITLPPLGVLWLAAGLASEAAESG